MTTKPSIAARWFTWGTAVLGIAFLATFVWGNILSGGYSIAESLLVLTLGLLCFIELFAFAVWTRRKRLILSTGIVVFVLSTLVLVLLGPHSGVRLHCRICGRDRIVGTSFGATWYDKERESELSEWYQQVNLPEHTHDWIHLCSTEKSWGADDPSCADSFGFALAPLHRLREVWERVDDATFQDLAQQYIAMQEDPSLRRAFGERCRALLPAEELPENDANKQAD
jgi:hypothetical protein